MSHIRLLLCTEYASTLEAISYVLCPMPPEFTSVAQVRASTQKCVPCIMSLDSDFYYICVSAMYYVVCLCTVHSRGTQEGVLCTVKRRGNQEGIICTMSVQSTQKRDTGGCPMSRVPHLCPSLTVGCRLASQEADALRHHDESDQTSDARYNRPHEGGGKGRVGH